MNENEIKSIGVIGAGVMGQGVAHAFAACGYQVYLIDTNEQILNKAKNKILENARLYAFLNPEMREIDLNALVEKIIFTQDYSTLAEVNFIVENVTENFSIKEKVYFQINNFLNKKVFVAANTSAISITRLASLLSLPQNVIGIHFMNPVPMKRMVEIIRAVHTSEETLKVTTGLMEAIGKDFVIVKDWPGFVSNRVLMLTINEAIFLVQEGIASVPEIDRLFKGCFEHKMGPLETADMIGLDTILYSINVLYESFQDPKYRPCVLLKQMVDAGFYGRKSGKGFYEY